MTCGRSGCCCTGCWWGAGPSTGTRRGSWRPRCCTPLPEAPHARNPRVPEALSAVCLRMLEKAPEARHADAEAVCEALEKALAGADAAWDVPLCEAWEESCTTTVGHGRRSGSQWMARARRLDEAARARPLRGRPPMPPDDAPPFLPEDVPFLDERALALTTAPVLAEAEPVRRRRPGAWVLGALVLLCAAHLCAPPGGRVPSSGTPCPAAPRPLSFVAWVWSGQEMAPRECPLEGDAGAVHLRVFHPRARRLRDAPQGRHTREDLAEDRTDATQAGCGEEPRRPGAVLRNPGRTRGVLRRPGARQSPARGLPGGCPGGHEEAGHQNWCHGMRTFRVRPSPTSRSHASSFEKAMPDSRLRWTIGQLKFDTVFVGRFVFGKERVSGRFSKPRSLGGPSTLSVSRCGTPALYMDEVLFPRRTACRALRKSRPIQISRR